MTFEELVPAETEHAIFIGKNGCGKTFAASHLVPWIRQGSRVLRRRYVLAYDPKGLLDWHKTLGAVRVTTLKDCVKKANDPDKFPWIVYAPTADELRDAETHEAFFRLAYDRRNCTVYVDEVYAVCPRGSQVYPPSLHSILTRGREMNVELIMSTQRPSKIPTECMSEAKRWYVFRLTMKDDRKKVSEMIPADPESFDRLTRHHFYYYNDDEDGVRGPQKLGV